MHKRALLLVLLILPVIPAPAGAHRLDEYLQATRVGIERDRVNVDIDLTPGVSIAGQVMAWLDLNGDGEISSTESIAYGRQVLASLAMSVDGEPVRLSGLDAQAPAIAEMAMGLGTIRVRASGISSSRSGRHQLTIINTHHPESSVYLANALVPSDKGIEILGQHRSADQHSLTIEYEIGMSAFRARIAWLGVVVTLVSTTFWARRRLGHFSQRQTSPI
jgi:hypothetical protein